ncbi:MAG: hypothetical protein F7C07_05030 [Desulfurococcales archaeon]|nr:hypothetical protein [Desulfurococcales archaeon]
MGLRRFASLARIDTSDSLRPPGFDLMLLIVSILGAALVAIQPLTQPHTAAAIILNPTLFATSIFLALRSAGGITGLIQSGLAQVYMAYPVSRIQLLLVLLASRILAPALALMSAPLLVAAVILYPVVSSDPESYLVMFSAYLGQAILYGLAFTLISLRARSPGTATIASITFYFAYIVSSILMATLSPALREPLLGELADAMSLYVVVNRYLSGATVDVWQLALVPSLVAILFLAVVAYFTRRFEPV